MKKLKKLTLKREAVVSLSEFEQSRLIGGGDILDYIDQYLTGMQSRIDIANCVNGYVGSERSYCYCTNGQNTCNSCGRTCDGGILPGGCNYTNDYEICRTNR